MEYIRQTVNGAKLNTLFDIPLELRGRDADVIILFPDDDSDANDKPVKKRQLGFAKGADVPASFFEPL